MFVKLAQLIFSLLLQVYLASADKVLMPWYSDDSQIWDMDPSECNYEYGYYQYNCMDRTCTDLTVKPEGQCPGKCHLYCWSPCLCKQAGCEYNAVEGRCQRNLISLDCREQNFGNNSCLQKGNFYVNNGVICEQVDTGAEKCGGTPLVAVNFNGNDFTDSNGISYSGDTDSSKEKIFSNIPYNKESRKTKDVKGEPESDKRLFKTYAIVPSDNGCVGVYFDISKDGNYEAVLKTLEPSKKRRMERVFNIWLHNTIVVPAFDIVSFRPRKTMFSLVIKFTAFTKSSGDRFIEIPGFPPFPVEKKMTFRACGIQQLPHRMSLECSRLDPLPELFPVVSAMYVAETKV